MAPLLSAGHTPFMTIAEQLSEQRATPSAHRGLAPARDIEPGVRQSLARRLDSASQSWIDRLSPKSPQRTGAIEELHALLLKATRFEVNRRNAALSHLPASDRDDLAHQSADDALVAVLSKLGDFRGESRFTTWVYKFALLEAGVRVRRRAWQEREVRLEPGTWNLIADPASTPERELETSEVFAAVQEAIQSDLTTHQRAVLVATTLNHVPIDVLAERLDKTRGALYKTIHDARRKLRAALAARGLSVGA
jgi:RNA polymerase sigma-70 factor, ECF subfamily